MKAKLILFALFLCCVLPGLARAAAPAAPPADFKGLVDAINQLRGDPAAAPDAVRKLLAAGDPAYETSESFTKDPIDGRTRKQNLEDFDRYAEGAQKLPPLAWDADLAAVAAREGKSANGAFSPEVNVMGYGKPLAAAVTGWVVDYRVGAAHAMRQPGLAFVGIAVKAGNPEECRVVVSSVPGKAFLLAEAELATRPYDAREDRCAPWDDALNVKPPNITSFVKADGTLDVAWRDMAAPPTVYVTRWTAAGQKVWTKPVPGVDPAHHPLLAGFTEDPQGNMYVLRATDEGYLDKSQEPHVPEVNGKPDETWDRPDLMKLTKLDPNGTALWTKDLAKKGGPGGNAIVSPLSPSTVLSGPDRRLGHDRHASTSRIGFTTIKGQDGAATPIVFALFGGATEWDKEITGRHQNCYWRALDARTGDPVPAKNGAAMAHSFDSQLLVTDEGIITVERSDGGLLMSNYLHTRPDPIIFIFHYATTGNGNDCFTQVGSVAPATDGYLLLMAGNHSEAVVTTEVNGAELDAERTRNRDLLVMRVKKGFAQAVDALKDEEALKVALDSKKRSPVVDEQTLLGRKYLTDYVQEGGYSAARPKMVRLADGTYVVMWERWSHHLSADKKAVSGTFDSTWAMKINQDGEIVKPPVKLSDRVRITRGDEPVLWNGKATFLTGDAAENVMTAHTVDGDLNYRAVTLPLH